MANTQQSTLTGAAGSLSWYQLSLKAITKLPTPRHLSDLEKRYPLLTMNPERACLYGYLWLAAADLVGLVLRYLVRWLLYLRQTLTIDILSAQWGTVAVEISVLVVRDLLFQILIYTLLHIVAKAMGQKGRYSHLVFLISLYTGPFLLLLGAAGGILPPTTPLFSITLIVILYFSYVGLRVYEFVYHVGRVMGALILIVLIFPLMFAILFAVQIFPPDVAKYLAWY